MVNQGASTQIYQSTGNETLLHSWTYKDNVLNSLAHIEIHTERGRGTGRKEWRERRREMRDREKQSCTS